MDYVVTFGEGMLRLAPPAPERLCRARTLEVQVCGSQGNVACNLARLGLKTAFVTKLPENALGRLLVDHYAGCGVDTSHIRLVPGARLGLNFIEFGAAPRPSASIYDRRNSAASTIACGDFDWPAILKGARLAYTDGILPGLSATCLAATKEFLAAARAQGCPTGFDVNYREHLWTPEQAGAALAELLPLVDILITSPTVSEMLFGLAGPPEQVLRALNQRFGCRIVAATLRELEGARRGAFRAVVLCDGTLYESRRYEMEVVDRFGTGDAWDAGFFYGYLTRRDPQFAVEFAGALCALAHTIPGDVALVTVPEVEAVMSGQALDVRR